MRALCIPRQTIDWLSTSLRYVKALAKDLSAGTPASGQWNVGALRVRSSEQLTVFWHRDFASAATEVDWLLVRLDGEMGFLSNLEALPSALDRMVRVSHLRFRNLNIPHMFAAKPYDGGRYTCFAGVGANQWRNSMGWLDQRIGEGEAQLRLLGFVGPWADPADNAANQAMALLKRLEADRNTFRKLLIDARKARQAPAGELTDDDSWSALRELEGPVDEAKTGPEKTLVAELPGTVSPMEDLTFEQCIGPDGPLTAAQQQVLSMAKIGTSPVRVHGPAGCGKSLLMQLLAVDAALQSSEDDGKKYRSVLYLAHNLSARDNVTARLERLAGNDETFELVDSIVTVATINDLAEQFQSIDTKNLLDRDNETSKAYQFELVKELLRKEVQDLHDKPEIEGLAAHPLIRSALESETVLDALSAAVVHDIGYVIKAQLRGQEDDAYVLAERPYSRLHGALNETERELIMRVYHAYDHQVLHLDGLLDNDDVALTLLDILGTRAWRLARKERGHDLLLIDEAQLYSTTEKLLFQYLCRDPAPPHPMVLAFDNAQELAGANEQALGLLGVGATNNVEVHEMHRCSPAITRVAVDIVLQTTDVFDDDFRPFLKDLEAAAQPDSSDGHPTLQRAVEGRVGKGALRAARALRQKNHRRVGIIALTTDMFEQVKEASSGTNVIVLEDRSANLPKHPHVVLGSPASVGGLEFDGVVIVGCEEGLFPASVSGSSQFQAILDQQSLRELYVSVTRAKETLTFLLTASGKPSRLLSQSLKAGRISSDQQQK
ncbi:MAG: 3'-5' exonuclease [Acidobacteriota bacterium]